MYKAILFDLDGTLVHTAPEYRYLLVGNIIKFLKEIGYVYCKYKEDLQKEALAYLQWRETLGKGNYTFKPIIGFEEWWKRHYQVGFLPGFLYKQGFLHCYP